MRMPWPVMVRERLPKILQTKSSVMRRQKAVNTIHPRGLVTATIVSSLSGEAIF
jgi:hypothetical protein